MNKTFLTRLKLIGATGLLLMANWAVQPQPAAAASAPCPEFQGYFSGAHVTSGSFVLPNGINQSNSGSYAIGNFTTDIHNYWQSGNTQSVTGAQFIMLTMMGNPCGTAKSTVDGNFFNAWSDRVNEYANAGRVNFNYALPFPCPQINSFYNSVNGGDDAFYNETAGSQSSNACGPSATVQVIAFFDGSGNLLYAIKHNCGNPVGNIAPLPHIPQPTPTPTSTPTPTPTPPPIDQHLGATIAPISGLPFGSTITAGASYTMNAQINNFAGNSPTDQVYLEVPVPGNIIANGFSPPGSYGNSAGQNNGGCNTLPSGISFPTVPCAGPHWYWGYSGIPGGAGSSSQWFSFTVSPSAPGGTNICFRSFGSSRSRVNETAANESSNYASSATGCYTVTNPRLPYIAAGGDVHAGGGIAGSACATAPAGTIQGQTDPGSTNPGFAQYVVSAGGSISQFGSGGSSGGSGLTFGNNPTNGFYGTVCRPDLAASASAYSPHTIITTNAINLATLGAGVTELFPASGTTVTLIGSPTQRVTVYVHGDVYITSNINISGTSRANLTTLGVVATGGIYINNSVTTLNGFFAAGGGASGQFVTCGIMGGGNVATYQTDFHLCSNNLTLNGFALANSFRLGRSGNSSSSGSIQTELFNASGALFLATPPAFSNDSLGSIYTGELPPVY